MQRGPLSPQLDSGVWGDNPPVLSGARKLDLLYAITRTWDPPDPEPQQKIKQPAQTLYGSWGDSPPFSNLLRFGPNLRIIVDSWQPAPPVPFPGLRLPADLIAVAVNDPPFSNLIRNGPNLRTIVESWTTGYWLADSWARRGRVVIVEIKDGLYYYKFLMQGDA